MKEKYNEAGTYMATCRHTEAAETKFGISIVSSWSDKSSRAKDHPSFSARNKRSNHRAVRAACDRVLRRTTQRTERDHRGGTEGANNTRSPPEQSNLVLREKEKASSHVQCAFMAGLCSTN